MIIFRTPTIYATYPSNNALQNRKLQNNIMNSIMIIMLQKKYLRKYLFAFTLPN